jgi:predicted O-methyltransferase YrrM
MWEEYFAKIKSNLGARAHGFERIFAHLKQRSNPTIIETGTYREENNYQGDGCSTLLFDNYIHHHGGTLLSIDIDEQACKLARKSTTHAEVIQSDSVEFLSTLKGRADLLYLDSYNIQNWANDWAPSAHHLKELFAAKDLIKNGTLIVVDDNIKQNGKRLGKGRLIHELMESIGIEPFLDEYQLGWVWHEV